MEEGLYRWKLVAWQTHDDPILVLHVMPLLAHLRQRVRRNWPAPVSYRLL